MQTDWRPLAGFGRVIGVVVALTALLGSHASAQQSEIDPSDIWFSAFTLFQEGEAAETRGNLLEALSKYRESKPLFDGLARQYPSFHPELVRFRREQLVNAIAQLRERMRNNPGNHLNAAPPAGYASATPPSPDPGIVSQNPGSLTPVSPEFRPAGAPASSPSVPGGTPNTPTAAPMSPNGVNLPEWGSQPAAGGNGYRIPDAVVRPPDSSSDALPQDLGQIHQSRIRWMQEEIDRLNRRNLSLETDLEQRQRYLDNVQAQLFQAQKDAAERERQYQVAKSDPNRKAHAAELERLLQEALSELEKSRQQNEAVFAELRKTQQEMEALRREKESIEKERNELLAIVDGGESAVAIQQLMTENRRLKEKLAQAEAMAKRLSEESRDKDVEIALLKDQIERIDSERKKLIDENRRYESQMAELRQRLRDLGQELSPDELDQLASVSPKLVEENELLRSVVLKQLRRQSQIKQTKQLLLRGLDKLGHEAADLYALVEDLATGPSISPEERKMIRPPDVGEFAAASAVESVTGAIVIEENDLNGEGGGIVEVKKIEEELLQIQKAAQLDFREGRYAEAEENYRKFLKYRPRSVVCLCNLALVKLATKHFDDAEGLLEKAIALKSDNGMAYYLLGRTHFEQGRLDDALSRLNEGIRLDPTNAKAHNCVGVISSRKGFAKRAESAFTQAVTIDPSYADAHFNLAVLFATGEKPDANRAMNHYQKAVGLGIPRDAAIENFLSQSLFTTASNTP